MSSSQLIYTKRYEESEFFQKATEGSSQSSKGILITDLKKEGNRRRHPAENHIYLKERNECPCASVFQADTLRIKKSKRFISMAEDFSEKHKVSADVFREKCCVDVWLYFSTEIITKERKAALIKLIRMCDELMIIPRPRGMPEWCDYAVILTYVTHRLIIRKSKHY